MAAAGAIFSIASTVGGTYSQSQALKSEGEYRKQIADMNSNFASLQAEDAIKRGEKDAARVKSQARQVVGSQRAAYAAQGLDVNSGSALDLQEDTSNIGALDALTIRNNAYREAWGYKQSALSSSYEGKFAQMSRENEARNTLITGGMKSIGTGLSAYGYSKSSTKKGT